ncbi:2Fe-2S iron-sulfur cluster binding domain-containing protein [Pseudomonas aeruginosa]|uniref:2Fe-2S iron-sulfur cluster-binding protein n=1 Tax=Pseudomonas aeruginosa TaxID=287 RepID=UPI003459B370
MLRTRRVDAGHPRRRERLRGTPALRTLRRSSSAGVLVRRHRRLPPGVAPQRPEPARRKPPEHPRSPRGTGPGPPYACRAGICRTCETRVCAGEPEHFDHVLSDTERASGETLLICVSRCRGNYLELDL